MLGGHENDVRVRAIEEGQEHLRQGYEALQENMKHDVLDLKGIEVRMSQWYRGQVEDQWNRFGNLSLIKNPLSQKKTRFIQWGHITDPYNDVTRSVVAMGYRAELLLVFFFVCCVCGCGYYILKLVLRYTVRYGICLGRSTNKIIKEKTVLPSLALRE